MNKSVNKVLCLRVLKALIIVMIMIVKWKPKATTVLKRVDVGLSQHNKTTEKCLWEIFFCFFLSLSDKEGRLCRWLWHITCIFWVVHHHPCYCLEFHFHFFNLMHCLDEFPCNTNMKKCSDKSEFTLQTPNLSLISSFYFEEWSFFHNILH